MSLERARRLDLGRGAGSELTHLALDRREQEMGRPVVHFEIIGGDPGRLRGYYAELFGWAFDTTGEVSEAVSVPTDYGFTPGDRLEDGTGVPGGVGGGPGYSPRAMFYVAVPDVEDALRDAERLGGVRRMGPSTSPSGLVVGHFTDPAGNWVGVAGTS